MAKYVFDLDGTICEEKPTFERCLAQPKTKMLNKVNQLYDAGHFIIIYTARSWNEFEMTQNWLKTNGVRYNMLMCGKVGYDYWIDDRAHNADVFEAGIK